MAEWIAVARMEQLKPDRGVTVEARGRLVAIFQHDGQLEAMDDVCPHMGASLGGGAVCDGVVSCPWHGWRFRVTDGAWVSVPQSKLKKYAVRQAGDAIEIEVDWDRGIA